MDSMRIEGAGVKNEFILKRHYFFSFLPSLSRDNCSHISS